MCMIEIAGSIMRWSRNSWTSSVGKASSRFIKMYFRELRKSRDWRETLSTDSDARVPSSESMELNMSVGYREGSWYDGS